LSRPQIEKKIIFKNGEDTYLEAFDFLSDCTTNIVDGIFQLHVNVEELGLADTCPRVTMAQKASSKCYETKELNQDIELL